LVVTPTKTVALVGWLVIVGVVRREPVWLTAAQLLDVDIEIATGAVGGVGDEFAVGEKRGIGGKPDVRRESCENRTGIGFRRRPASPIQDGAQQQHA
jgi:hypothetical protein